MKPISFEQFVQTFNLPPLVKFKRACQIANVGPTKMYEFVGQGEFSIVKDGKSSSIPAEQLYGRYVRLLQSADGSRAA
jgi:hypothetical protein